MAAIFILFSENIIIKCGVFDNKVSLNTPPMTPFRRVLACEYVITPSVFDT